MTSVVYVEETPDGLCDRPAVILGEAERCAVCHEPAQGHDRRGRKHPYTPETGKSLRVTFPEGHRAGVAEEVTEYAFVREGTDANMWHR